MYFSSTALIYFPTPRYLYQLSAPAISHFAAHQNYLISCNMHQMEKGHIYNFRVQHYLFFKDFGLNELVTATCLCPISPLFCLTEFWWLWNFMNRFACKPHKPCLQTCSGGCAQKIGRLCQRFGKDKDLPASFPYFLSVLTMAKYSLLRHSWKEREEKVGWKVGDSTLHFWIQFLATHNFHIKRKYQRELIGLNLY